MPILPDKNAVASALASLGRRLSGEIRADNLHRALYATDASIYEIVPDGVVFPKSVGDVVATVRACAEHGVALTARGAGTGLAGGAVNRGVQLDCSRYLNRIVDIDPDGRTAIVGPGVVLDELNAELKQHGLHFAPDVATSSRATIGGMISNNSCGAHSVHYGRTVDHLLSVDVVLSDGSTCRWGTSCGRGVDQGSLASRCEETLKAVVSEYAEEIAARYPTVLRRNGGYALDRMRVDGGGVNPETVVCGSEGTLAIVVGATVKLAPLPRHRGLILVPFDDLLESLGAVPAILEHQPVAVELIDRTILEAASKNVALQEGGLPIQGEPEAVLIVEFFGDDSDALSDCLSAVAADLGGRGLGSAQSIITDPVRQARVWGLRSSGLGLLMSRPGDNQPYAFVEDSAVDPRRLREYIERFQRILAEEGIAETGYYAHASVGCLHVRPVLNLKRRDNVERMRRIADRVSSLALEFGGTMTGEHGDGMIRSCWLEKMYGARIIEAFRKVKRAFDPRGILNPGKIVDPMPMTEHLRFSHDLRRHEPESTALGFDTHGGMAGLAGMCSGVGQCRQRLVGTMCPSYIATSDERHTTRARANALRMALSNRGLIGGLDDPALDEVMDLCLSCKACKSECPTGVDMARLKSEWLWQRYRASGAPLRSRLIARTHELAAWGSRFSGLCNSMAQSRWGRGLMDALIGIDRRVPPPRLAAESFRRWYERRRGSWVGRGSRDAVVYFVDTWTNYFTPQVGIAALRVLEALGYDVIVPPTVCCGRPAISKGVLGLAKLLGEKNVEVLTEYASCGISIIGTEPSCLLTLCDELPQLVRGPEARRIASMSESIETFLASRVDRIADRLTRSTKDPILYHGHCHQKALVGTSAAMRVLAALAGDGAAEINSGCCGMAGSFGHEKEHYEVARAVGEQRLFPAVRERGSAGIAVSGFSCRHQIEHHTGASARHVVEHLADALRAE